MTLLSKIKKKIRQPLKSLSEYGKLNQTDKVNQYHSFAGKNYLDVYSMYFERMRGEKISLLEIGVREGASLRTFRDCYLKWNIIGLDIDPKTQFSEKRIKTYVGSQNAEDVISKIFSENHNIKIVLDDGSHINRLTIESFNLIFERLPPGSYYIIEDLACTYLEEDLKTDIIRGGWPGMDYNNPEIVLVNKRSDMDLFFGKLLKELDAGKGDVEFVHFWSQICIIKKVD